MSNPVEQALEQILKSTTTPSASSEHVCPHCRQVVPPMEIVVLGRKRTVQPRCRCEVEWFEEEMRRSHEAQIKAEIERLFSVSELGDRFANCTFENFQIRHGAETAFQVCKEFAERFEADKPDGVLIWGQPGNGKSHLAAAVTNYLLAKGHTVVFVTMPELLERIRNTFNRNDQDNEADLMRALLLCDLLVLDDIGAEKVTDWTQDVLFRIVDKRYRRNKPLLLTSNYTPEELRGRLDDKGRLYDRIVEFAVPVENKATSFRVERGRNRIAELVRRFKGHAV